MAAAAAAAARRDEHAALWLQAHRAAHALRGPGRRGKADGDRARGAQRSGRQHPAGGAAGAQQRRPRKLEAAA